MNLKILSLKCSFEQRVQRNQNINSADDVCICIVEMLLLDLLGKGVKPSRYI